MIYFIQAGDGGPIKIGFTTDEDTFVDRLVKYQTHNPGPVNVLALTAGGRFGEKALHAAFAEHRLQGEWFSPTPDLLALIAEVSEPDPDPVLASMPWWPADARNHGRPAVMA